MPFSKSFLDFLKKDIGTYSKEERQTFISMNPDSHDFVNIELDQNNTRQQFSMPNQHASRQQGDQGNSDRDYFSFNQIDLVFKIDNEDVRHAIETESG